MTEEIVIETHGSQIKSIVDQIRAIADEARFIFKPDGLEVNVVDPANVSLMKLEVDADGFDGYEYETEGEADVEVVTGVVLPRLKSALSVANKGQGLEGGDDIRITLPVWYPHGDPRAECLRVETETEDMTLTDTFFPVDPDSVMEPPTIPDMESAHVATQELPTRAFRDAIKHLNKEHDYTKFEASVSGGLKVRLYAEKEREGKDNAASSVSFAPEPEGDIDELTEEYDERAVTMVSMDYLRDIAPAVHAGGRTETAKVAFGNDYPIKIDYETTEWGLSGTYMVAPRIEDK